MSKELEKVQHMVREVTVNMSCTEYEEFMRQLSEWEDYQAECADWKEYDS